MSDNLVPLYGFSAALKPKLDKLIEMGSLSFREIAGKLSEESGESITAQDVSDYWHKNIFVPKREAEQIKGREAVTYDFLMKKVRYAKASYSMELLYEAHGRICTAYDLGALSWAQFLELDRECVRNGINNPEIFNRKE